jgi:hypothetical protein
MKNYSLIIDNYSLFTVILLASLILVGCSGNVPRDWTLTEQNDKVVWADDGSDVAIVVLRFEERQGSLFSGTTDKRLMKHKIFVQNLDGSKRHPINKDWRDFQNGQLFYMKQAGYFVIESLLENGARRFDKISMDGDEILIIETPSNEHQPCQQNEKNTSYDLPSSAQVHHTVIPSPNAQYLAHLYSPECRKVTVEFLHANNLNLFDTQTMDIEEPMNVTWHPEGYIIFTNNNNDKAWKVIPLAPPEPLAPPKCTSPVTTSSNVSLEGKMVYFEEDKLVTKDVGPQKAFGCQ